MLPLFPSLLTLLLYPALAFASPQFNSSSEETFSETLTIRPLSDGKVNARFEFVTLINQTSSNGHSTLAPAFILSLLKKHEAQAFELVLTAGVWDHSRWGYPLSEAGGTGAELWAWMGVSAKSDSRHEALTQSLSGLFCASLGQSLTNGFTTRPHIPHLTSESGSIPYHTTSPPSGLCTENLTPFVKLLPSKGHSGISGLLKSHRVLAGNWHSMSVKASLMGGLSDVARFGPSIEHIEIRMGFEIVWDLIGRNRGNELRDLSFQKIFHASLPSSFPPVSSSELILHLPSGVDDKDYTILPHGFQRVAEHGVDSVRWDLKSADGTFDIEFRYNDASEFVFPSTYKPPPLSIERSVLGATQIEGAFRITIANNLDEQKEVFLLEEWPWWVGGWLGERTITLDGVPKQDILRSISYTPSIPHDQPTTLVSHLILPPQTTIEINSPFIKQFLQYNEHLPDASRGFELCAAILFPSKPPRLPSLLPSWESPPSPTRIYTGNVLIDLATPDFSMPYNVIIMSCTLLALLFGSVFNILTRKLVAIDSEHPLLNPSTLDLSDPTTKLENSKEKGAPFSHSTNKLKEDVQSTL
ncbi:GPI transamidase complex, GPI16/PIG-T component, involved in glycosylphosphatidylinositol anchor biosynthesis [Phaffia rhodozyma]|uniref:GPI transamidase complex, GPI16/PIG-T component, involved in glycosylphosphatidylinositol anchor biosynthesis n=1 Tax=Phaffia rhodozyma TaxID=264483 RepID=A0A0F7SJX6_PHARH|nr:GPI transamidase complex, GPI16/PIG-T component, involved in glycosylphosphatidylinositol anchor biosynthesis [Phaffia rhodozyma]